MSRALIPYIPRPTVDQKIQTLQKEVAELQQENANIKKWALLVGPVIFDNRQEVTKLNMFWLYKRRSPNANLPIEKQG